MENMSQYTPAGRGKNKRYWTKDEEDALVDALVELSANPLWRGEGGFKNGFMFKLAEMVEEKFPDCGLKAVPHIDSKTKWFKDKYGLINEMLRRSEFSWDNEKNMITCDRQAYEDFCKQYPKAKGLWKTPFPYLEKLDLVFGLDRANGNRCELPNESIIMLANEIVNLGEDDVGEEESMEKEFMGIESIATEKVTTTIHDVLPQTSSSKKIKKDNVEEGKNKKIKTTNLDSDSSISNNMFMEFSGFMKDMNTHLATIASFMSTTQEHEQMLMAHEKEAMDRKKNLVSEVSNIPDLTRAQAIKIARLLASNPTDLDIFYSSPNMEWKRDFVLELLNA